MDETPARDVDRFFSALLPREDVLDAVLAANTAAGLPPHDVSPLQGRMLQVLARAIGARRVLEIGTLGAYSTIWLARALPADGRVVTLEFDARHAAVAAANLARAGIGDRVELRVGRALDTLPRLATEGYPPFDLVFVDADKRSSVDYLEWALALTRPGSLLVFDNVVRDGKVLDAASDDPSVQGVRRLIARLAAEPRVSATATQTVGAKGWDGFVLAVVEEPGPRPPTTQESRDRR
jgi:predicted O-methyltransferase YrrM